MFCPSQPQVATVVKNAGMNRGSTHTLPDHMEPINQHLLEASLQQQQMTQELARGLQAANQELLHRQATDGVPLPHLPDPKQLAQKLLGTFGPHDDVEAYI